jgi:hypothetical protein
VAHGVGPEFKPQYHKKKIFSRLSRMAHGCNLSYFGSSNPGTAKTNRSLSQRWKGQGIKGGRKAETPFISQHLGLEREVV